MVNRLVSPVLMAVNMVMIYYEKCRLWYVAY